METFSDGSYDIEMKIMKRSWTRSVSNFFEFASEYKFS